MTDRTNNSLPTPGEERTTAQLRAIARALRDRTHTFEDRAHLMWAEIVRIEALIRARRRAENEVGEGAAVSLGMDGAGFDVQLTARGASPFCSSQV